MHDTKPRRENTQPDHTLKQYFQTLLARFGPQGWWPARTRFEVIIGAILTQNTSWQNATHALRTLRRAGLLRPNLVRQMPEKKLATLIRSAGFYRQKAQTIHNFLLWLESKHSGSISRLFSNPPTVVRSELLSIKGIGPETADVIMLYAGRKPFFVADTYARRVLSRHQLIRAGASYAVAQAFVHEQLEKNYLIYNEYHALLVEVGKRYCGKSAPKCCNCPLEPFLPPLGPAD